MKPHLIYGDQLGECTLCDHGFRKGERYYILRRYKRRYLACIKCAIVNYFVSYFQISLSHDHDEHCFLILKRIR